MAFSRIAKPCARRGSTSSIKNASSSQFFSRSKGSSVFAMVLAVALPLLTTAMAISFQPVTYPVTAVLGSRLYVYGGLTDMSSPTSYTAQFVTLSLMDDFDTDDIPWEFLPSELPTGLAPGASSRDQRRFIVGGNRNDVGKAPAHIFDSTTRTWIRAPDIPVSGGGGEEEEEGGQKEGESGEEGEKNTTIPIQVYYRGSPGMALDLSNGMLIQFGGTNSSSSITNELTVLDTNKVTNRMNWTFVGTLDSVPALYAPILIYIPSSRATLIMGGCDQWINSNSNSNSSSNSPGNTTTHCAGFDTLYTVSSDSVLMASPKASQIRITGISPPARLMPCTVLLPDNNVLMIGGENPAVVNGSLGDAWILDTRSWTWHQRSIEGFPADGIMGHSCQLAPRDQILVVGGYTGSNFVENPLSVIKMRDWSWTGHYSVPGVSTGVKVGLAMSVVVVVGAIIAGLWIRRRRNKAAALAKEQGDHPNGGNQLVKSKSGNSRRRSEVSASGNGGHQRRKRSLPTRQQSVDHSREEPIELEGIESQPRTLDRSGGHADGEWDGTMRSQESSHEQGDQVLLIDSRASQSVLASSSSTIVGPSSPVADEDDPTWASTERDRAELGRRRIEEADQDRGPPNGHE